MKKIFSIIVMTAFMLMGISSINYSTESGIYLQNVVYAKGKKTVKVKSYVTKKGKVVKSHKRSKPKR